MSIFAVAILGFIFGWLACIFCLIFDRIKLPKKLEFIFDPKWPREVSDRDRVRERRRRRALTREATALSMQRLMSVKYWFCIAIFVATIMLIFIEVLQEFRSTSAASIEEILSEPRLATLLLAALAGFASRLYRRQLFVGLDTLSKIALVGGGESKGKSVAGVDGGDEKSAGTQAISYVDARFPWYVEFGLLLSIIIIAVFWINPQLLKNLTSFKAGGVEAHFATATGNATVQSGLIVAVDPARKTTTRAWATFEFPHAGDERFGTYSQTEIGDLRTAEIFFQLYLKPIFMYRNNLYESKHPLLSDKDRLLARLTTDFAALIIKHGVSPEYFRESLHIDLAEMCRLYLLDPVTACSPTPQQKDDILQQKTWDPYIIQGVADLLLVLERRKEQEDFLIAATSDADGTENICPAECKTAGQLSLMYGVVLAKVRSARPWPFSEMLRDLSKALDGIDAVLDHNALFQGSSPQLPTKSGNTPLSERVEQVFRRNRFIDLTLGLELFYQRALQGQRFTPQQTRLWHDWLAETRGVIDTLSENIAEWPPRFSDEVSKSWLRAKSEIQDRPDALEDAYVGIALSLALIGSSDSDISERDCVAARSFQIRANDALPSYFKMANLDNDDKGTYRGFLEQVKNAIDTRCKPD